MHSSKHDRVDNLFVALQSPNSMDIIFQPQSSFTNADESKGLFPIKRKYHIYIMNSLT